ESAAAPAAVTDWLNCAGLGPDRQGLYRILYRIMDEAEVYLARSSTSANKSHAALTPTVHLRVPRCAESTAEALKGWVNFLRRLLEPDAELLLYMPQEQEWVDVIVGPPAAESAFFLASSAETLTSQIPYSIDADFRQRADQLVAAAGVAQPAPPLA